jgi:hypothetical protein
MVVGSHWPLITLNLDFKTNEPEHLRAVLALLNEYRNWLTTAPRTAAEQRRSHSMCGPFLC